MALNLLPLNQLGAIETNGAVTFGLWLPWVSVMQTMLSAYRRFG
jgi:hypothetical protein